MKLAICIVAISAIVGMCTNNDAGKYIAQSDQLIEYQLDGDQYAVVVVQDGISPSQANSMARQRAAQITVQMGGRYFTIDSDTETQVIRPSGDWPNNQQFYGNMYQELIIEGNFGKQSMQRQQALNPQEQMFTATRLVFTMYVKKPAGKKSIDACTLTNCNQ